MAAADIKNLIFSISVLFQHTHPPSLKHILILIDGEKSLTLSLSYTISIIKELINFWGGNCGAHVGGVWVCVCTSESDWEWVRVFSNAENRPACFQCQKVEYCCLLLLVINRKLKLVSLLFLGLGGQTADREWEWERKTKTRCNLGTENEGGRRSFNRSKFKGEVLHWKG